ncbi:MAG TPA: SdrD B-like domain-containing protein [Anaerolineales bacterium]|nr:SdrD B-like domain-containing protein [Anaerolineales bacterium]
MKLYLRMVIVIVVVTSVAMLAKNKVAWAGDARREAAQADLANLKGFVWNDADQDGLQDAGESGLANVTVNLYDKAKAFVNAALTDQTGHYQFEKLAAGDYYLDFVAPAGFAISPKDQSQDEALDSDADSVTGETSLTTLVAGENTLAWDVGLYTPGSPPGPEPGTVKPPPGDITICEEGVHSVGGVSTLEVNDLAPGYCLVAFLRDHAFAVGRIPDGAGTVLADITFLRVFYQGRLVHELPEEDGQVKICYSVLAVDTAQIYFFDFYGPRSGERSGQPSWEPLETTVDGGKACAAAQTTGAYALIGK